MVWTNLCISGPLPLKLPVKKNWKIFNLLKKSAFEFYGDYKGVIFKFGSILRPKITKIAPLDFKIHKKTQLLRKVHWIRNFSWANIKCKLLFLMEISHIWPRVRLLVSDPKGVKFNSETQKSHCVDILKSKKATWFCVGMDLWRKTTFVDFWLFGSSNLENPKKLVTNGRWCLKKVESPAKVGTPNLGVKNFFLTFDEIDRVFSASTMTNLILNRMVPVRNSRKHVILRRSRLNAKNF